MNMYVVHFFENKNLLLTQLLQRVPAVGEELRIKGRKGKISSVANVDEKNIHVEVVLESVKKNKVLLANTAKKKR